MDKRQIKLLVVASAIIIGVSMFIPSGNMRAAEKAKLKKFEVGGGSVGGVYFIAANTFADLFQKKLGMNIPFTASASEGSAENVRLIDLGRMEAATIASNAMYPSWYGQKPYEKQYRNGRIVMWVFPNPTVFFALAEKNITKIKDLKGKRVGVGAGPSTWDHLAGPFLEAHGIDYKKDIRRVYGSFEDLSNQVRDGLLDASIGNISAGVNLLPAISALATEKRLAFLDWDTQAVEGLSAKIPYFKKAIVKAAALPGRQTDYLTVDLGAQLFVVRHDLPEELVYKITEVIHKNLTELVKTVKFFSYAVDNPKFMTQKLGEVEFHPGSLRYWKEVGLW